VIVYGGTNYYGTGTVVISGGTTYCYTIQNEVGAQAYDDTVGSTVGSCNDGACYVIPTTTTTAAPPPPTTTTTVAPATTTTLAPTTTTTTEAPPSFYYNNAYRNSCGGSNPCTDDGVEVVLRSTTPLSNGSWYSDGTKSYQPYGGTSGPYYDIDIDPYIYTQASSCEDACNNY
jgi:hypothetical protein